MQTSALRADTHADVRGRARSPSLDRRLAQFHPQVRARVQTLARSHPRLKDLAGSFPALLFALAVPRRGIPVADVAARVIDGAPLRDVAALARVPLWLREVDPRSLSTPLPGFPDGEFFHRQIGNFIPACPRQFPTWAQAVADAAVWADETVALWVARELARRPKQVTLARLRGVCLWAWYSRSAQRSGLCTVPTPWTWAMAFEYALRLSRAWLKRVELHIELSENVDDMWLTPGVVDGFEFVPLRTAKDIAAEAGAMKHCVAEYGGSVRHDWSRLWSVRHAGDRVATLEIGFPGDDPLPSVAQLKGVRNATVPLKVWLAARRWLNGHDLAPYACRAKAWEGLSQRAWMAQWKPYWLAKGGFAEWLPLGASRDALEELLRGVPQRARRRRR